MRIVAVRAADAAMIHQALLEAVIVEDLVLHLPVMLEQPRRERYGAVRFRQRASATQSRGDLPPSRMTAGAGFDGIPNGPTGRDAQPCLGSCRCPVARRTGWRDRGEALERIGALAPLRAHET